MNVGDGYGSDFDVSVAVGRGVLDEGVVDVGNSVGVSVGGSGVDVEVNVGVGGMGVSVGTVVFVGGLGVIVGVVGVWVGLGGIAVGVALGGITAGMVLVGGITVGVADGGITVGVVDGSGEGVSVNIGVKLGRMGATFGTWSFCPTRIVVEDPKQFADCNWATLTL